MRARHLLPNARPRGGPPGPGRARRPGSILRAARAGVVLLYLVPLALPLAAATPAPGGGAGGLHALLSVRPRDVDGTPAATGIRAARASRPVLALAEPRVPSLAGPEPGGRPDPRELQPAPLAVSSRLDPSRGPPPA